MFAQQQPAPFNQATFLVFMSLSAELFRLPTPMLTTFHQVAKCYLKDVSLFSRSLVSTTLTGG
jgi:hypothetical protein